MILNVEFIIKNMFIYQGKFGNELAATEGGLKDDIKGTAIAMWTREVQKRYK